MQASVDRAPELTPRHDDLTRPSRVIRVPGVLELLRAMRRSTVGGAVEYMAQLMDGVIHRQLLRSGATDEEELGPLPGDDLVPHPTWQATRAVSIDARAVEVWPWVAQMGYGRGGWYGWNPLEREDTGVAELLPQFASPHVGDLWLDGPGCDQGRGVWKITALDPPQTLILHTMRDTITGRELDPREKPRVSIDTVWSFHLEDAVSGRHSVARQNAASHVTHVGDGCRHMDGRRRHGDAAQASGWNQTSSRDDGSYRMSKVGPEDRRTVRERCVAVDAPAANMRLCRRL
jgi:hypothetical protein